MFNVIVEDFCGKLRFRYFNKMVFDHEPPRNRGGRRLVSVPFTDESGQVLEGYQVDDFSECEERRLASIQASLSRTKNKIQRIALSTDRWAYFATFTFDPAMVGDRFDYTECSRLMTKFLKECMRLNPTMQYLIVPEKHSSGAWHFHGLFSDEIAQYLQYSGCFGSNKTHCYSCIKYKYGFTSFSKVKSVQRVCYYIAKYMTKGLVEVTKFKRRYWWSTSTISIPEKSKFLMSPEQFKQFLEAISDYIENGGIQYAKDTLYSYIDFTVSPEAIDYIFDYISGFDDGIYYSVSDDC